MKRFLIFVCLFPGIALAVLIANRVTAEGSSNWFEGVQLLSVYLILAFAFGFA